MLSGETRARLETDLDQIINENYERELVKPQPPITAPPIEEPRSAAACEHRKPRLGAPQKRTETPPCGLNFECDNRTNKIIPNEVQACGLN